MMKIFLRRFKTLRNNKFQKELRGTIHILFARLRYLKKPANFNVEAEIEKKTDLNSYNDFFMAVERDKMVITKRNNPTHIAKNISSVEQANMRGKEWVKFLCENGLDEDSSVLDYGCGGLRLGKSVIEFVDTNKYVGVDISDFFYTEGIKKYLGEKLVNDKKPKFFVIGSDGFMQDLKGVKFNIIYSTMVATHIPPDELVDYFQKIVQFMDQKSIFLFDFQPSLFTMQQNSLSWGFPYRKVVSALRYCGAEAEVSDGHLLKVSLRKK